MSTAARNTVSLDAPTSVEMEQQTTVKHKQLSEALLVPKA